MQACETISQNERSSQGTNLGQHKLYLYNFHIILALSAYFFQGNCLGNGLQIRMEVRFEIGLVGLLFKEI